MRFISLLWIRTHGVWIKHQHCSIERHTTYAFLCNIHVEPYLPLDCCEQCLQLEYANMPCNSQCRQFNEDHSIHSASSQSNLLLLFCALRAMWRCDIIEIDHCIVCRQCLNCYKNVSCIHNIKANTFHNFVDHYRQEKMSNVLECKWVLANLLHSQNQTLPPSGLEERRSHDFFVRRSGKDITVRGDGGNGL